MIIKENLVEGQYYWGDCRNANTARWNGRCFIYHRTGAFPGDFYFEEINHPEDDDGHDLFIPMEVVTWGTDFIPLET